jgi:hypothetical protein
MLSDIKQHLQQQKMLSLAELSQQFQTDAQTMHNMLGVLIRKGHVRQCTKTPSCGTACNQCVLATVQFYEWAGNSSESPRLDRGVQV